jgi:hypothetical protein
MDIFSTEKWEVQRVYEIVGNCPGASSQNIFVE